MHFSNRVCRCTGDTRDATARGPRQLNSIILLFELLLLVCIGVLYFIALRDLTARAIQKQSPAIADLKELRDAVEQLISSLEERASKIQDSLSRVIEEAESRTIDRSAVDTLPMEPVDLPHTEAENVALLNETPDRGASVAAALEAVRAAQSANAIEVQFQNVPPPGDSDRYGKVYLLYDDGITDPKEIARRSGIGLPEVMLVLSLRPRQTEE